jgi:spore coat protein U-like protein
LKPALEIKFASDVKFSSGTADKDPISSFQGKRTAMSIRDAVPVLVLGILGSGLTLRPAGAATASASFGVSAVVQDTCRASATDRASRIFAGGTTNATSPVSVTCSNQALYNVNFSAGTGLGANLTLRALTGAGTALLGNALNSFQPRLVSLDKSVGTDAATWTGNRSAQAFADHEQIAAGQHVSAGAYFDTIIVTVTY